MGEFELDVIFAGQTGSGKSSLINMIMGVRDGAKGAAEVSNNSHPCTLQNDSYPTTLEKGLRCKLWDTRGLDEGVVIQSLLGKLMEKIRQRGVQQQRELKEALKERTKGATPILIWCIEARNISAEYQWKLFQRVYTEYCQTKAIPAIAITQGPHNAADWEERCRRQLQALNLDVSVPFRIVRRYQIPLPPKPGPEYDDDVRGLRDLISQLSMQVKH